MRSRLIVKLKFKYAGKKTMRSHVYKELLKSLREFDRLYRALAK